MTFTEKLNWLENASAGELINQLKWTVTALSHGSTAQRIEAQEDYELIIDALTQRLER